MTNYADENIVAGKAAEWSDGQLDCRLNRHNWNRRMTVVSHGKGYYEIVQTCTRKCGVKRKTELDENGYQTKQWQMDYRDALHYLMTDDNGHSLGRIGNHGRAALWRQALLGFNVIEVPDDD